MIEFSGRGILLDIEGTTSSVSFVYDVMFPFARRELPAYLRQHWGSPALNEACNQIALDAGHDSFFAWTVSAGADSKQASCQLLEEEVVRLMDGDLKATGLKQLQGLIWRSGFESGEMQAHVYDDVPPALESWSSAGCDVRIYSSGSIAAQKLFFSHTIFGNLLSHFRGHYDTTTGGKKEADSYCKIAESFPSLPAEILFISDVLAELDAARSAGMQTALCRRPGNADLSTAHGHAEIEQFDQILLK